MKYLNTIPTRGLNLIKSWLRPGFILLSILFTIGVGQMNAYTLYFYMGRLTDWRNDGAVFKLNNSNAAGGTTLTRVGSTDWYSCSTTASGTMYIVRCNSAGNSKWNSFSASISSTNNVVRLTDWNAGEVFSMYVTGNNWNSIGTWDNANVNGKMTISTTNTFSKTFTNVAASAHQFKIVEQGRWDYSVGWGGSITGTNCTTANASGNIQFTPEYGTGSTTITYNISTGAITITCPKNPVPTISLSAPSSGVRGESVTLTATVLNASTPTIVYQYSTNSTFASSVTDIASTTNTSQSWPIPSGTSGTTYYLRAKMTISGTTYYSSILTFTAYGKKTIWVRNSKNWSTFNVYSYAGSPEVAWPGNGTRVVATNGTWKQIKLSSQYTGFILNAGNDQPQTPDLAYADYTDGCCYAISIAANGSGQFPLPTSTVECQPANHSGYTLFYGNDGKNGDGGTDASFTLPWGFKDFVTSSGTTSQVTITATAEDIGKVYEFKIINGSGTWLGYNSASGGKIESTISDKTLNSSYGNGRLCITVPGTYTISFNSSGNKLGITYPAGNYLRGDFNSWGWDDELTPTGNANEYACTISLSAKQTWTAPDHGFKIVIGGVHYGKNSTSITRANNTASSLETSGSNIGMKTDVAGSYTFTFNSSTKNLTVTYPTAYTITYGVGNLNGSNSAIGATATPSFSNGDYVLRSTAVTFTKGATKAGYAWKGWYSAKDGTGTEWSTTNANWTSAANTRTGNITVYACYTYANYTVTLNKQTSATGYGTSGSCGNQTVTYNTSLPAISGSMPSGAQGYGFMGFYTATGGGGVKLINADGTWVRNVDGYTTADGKWNRTNGCILYAYYKQSKITDIELTDPIMDPVPSETGTEADYVIANPVFDPYPSPTVTVEWRMLYSDGISEVPDRTATAYTEGGTKPFQVSFDIVGMVAGVYKIEANLKSSGVVISSYQKIFRIANDYTVTIKYMCGEEEIQERITQPGNPIDWQDVTAPDIFGYKFLRWNPGDGITLESANTTKNNRYHAEYDSKLTAYYTKEQYIYLDLSQTFSTDGKWSNPYVYFYSADPWVNNKGAGAKDGGNTHKNYISGHAMTQIDGTDIWYFDYSGVSGSSSYIAFTWGNMTGQENFNATDVIFRGDFSEGTPLFVPATDGAASTRKETVNGAQYYNKGYWVNYVGPKTGYTMLIYNSAGNVELKRELFLSEDKHVPMTASVELDATSTYQIEVYRDNGHYYQHTNGNFTTSSRGPKPLNGSSKLSIKTNAAGSYIFTLGYSSGNLQLSVNYPASMGDFRVTYTDNDTWGRGVAHVARTWIMTSHILPHEANRVDTVSFFISKDHSPEIRWQKITTVAESSVSWGTTTGTCSDWLSDGYTDVTESGVYNFKVTQNADGSQIASIERIGRYEGNYYIRCGALNSKWDHYTTDEDHLMTYSAFSESEENSFGEKYSHYKAKWCERGKNIKFCIANDYSPSISDTLLYDNPNSFDNVESDGRLKTDGSSDPTADRYSANVRFMWNRHTNKISRAYVASATNVAKRFLVLVGTDGLKDKDGNAIAATANLEANAVLLHDDQNWIYETYIRAVPGTLVKLYASYAQTSPSPNGAQYFRGSYGAFDAGHTIQILGGEGSTPQRMRVIYDFKTNRLVTAWLPGATIDGNLEIEADVMIIRDHQKDAECITFANKGSKLSEVKTVYGVLQFNRWTLNNRRRGPGSTIDEEKEHCKDDETISEYHPLLSGEEQLSIHERSQYFISFPFDVNLSDVFGFGTYGEQWIISRYNGLRRAQKGFFADNCFNDDCTNWDYIHSYFGIDHTSFVLKANEGYLLSLDLSQMEYDDTTHFWLNQIHNVELFFPSAVPLAAIENTTATIEALPSTYECKINHNDDGMHPEKDHTKKDSYWRCIGVPSFANYDGSLSNPETSSTIVWQSHPSWEIVAGNLPFLYEWNTTDNSLMPRATSNYKFRSTFSYLVQCSTAIYWSAVVGKKPASIVSRQHEATKEYNWRLTLEKNGEVEDQTFVRMADNEFVTENFDFNQDLVKEEKYNHANIYSFIGTEKVAANSMPLNTENTTVVPLGITLWYDKHAGDYTFALPDGADGIGITLVDSETGTRTNLSAGMDYTVYLEKGNYTNRFYLEIAKIQNVATGTEEIGEPSKSDVRKVMINGILYIVRGDRIYDARGIRVE